MPPSRTKPLLAGDDDKEDLSHSAEDYVQVRRHVATASAGFLRSRPSARRMLISATLLAAAIATCFFLLPAPPSLWALRSPTAKAWEPLRHAQHLLNVSTVGEGCAPS